MIESWLPVLQSFSKLWTGFSGGLDSTVLLDNLARHRALLPPIHAIHINHGISPHAAAWQAQSAEFCDRIAIPFFSHRVNFDKGGNIEEAARTARYEIFRATIQPGEALLLAHHADDQAETLLLQLFRGTGINGLAAMPEIMDFAPGRLLRPLLGIRRKTLENYAVARELTWVEDESNLDEKFSRNYLRHAVIPMLEQKWPGLVGNINRTARHCQEALANLETLAALDLAAASEYPDRLSLERLENFSRARIMNCLRFWLKKNHFRLPSTAAMEAMHKAFFSSRTDAEPDILLEDRRLRRYQNTLYLTEKHFPPLPEKTPWAEVAKLSQLLGYDLFARAQELNLTIPENAQAEIRFRKGGEVIFQQGQHKDLKKLLQAWKIPPWLRNRIPLLYVDNCLMAVLR